MSETNTSFLQTDYQQGLHVTWSQSRTLIKMDLGHLKTPFVVATTIAVID